MERSKLGEVYQQFYKTGFGAEIGVQNGFNARAILSLYSGKLYLVDYWADVLQLKNTVLNLIHYKDRAIYLPVDSLLAADLVEDESLDFIYIDAGHSYIEVKSDFLAWYPKVRSGGIISGHDYGENDCIGVKMFIDEFMNEHPEIEMIFTEPDIYEGMNYHSFYFIKP